MKWTTTVLAFCYIGLNFPGVAMATEEPKFKLISQTDQYEVRQYAAVLVAETRIDAGFDEAGNRAFRVLADYIFGNNKSKAKIAMTAPVIQGEAPSAVSEKIAMTAPVTQVQSQGGFLVQFTMPESFTLETLPEPNDSRVKIRQIPARKLAVFSYSGSWSQSHYQEKLAEFQAALSKDGVKTVGAPTFARYNSPFMIWFLRRNEIWIEVANR